MAGLAPNILCHLGQIHSKPLFEVPPADLMDEIMGHVTERDNRAIVWFHAGSTIRPFSAMMGVYPGCADVVPFTRYGALEATAKLEVPRRSNHLRYADTHLGVLSSARAREHHGIFL